MSYERVIPRDLFNDANLLKCVGKVCLLIHDNMLELEFEHDGREFDIEQNEDGDTYVQNLRFQNLDGGLVYLYRPLNARASWPLLSDFDDDNCRINVFDDNGNISDEFNAMLAEFNRPKPK